MLKQLNIEQIDQLQSYIEERRVVMNPALIGRVSAILEDVRMHGDEAVLRYTKQFDGMELNKLRVSSEELNAQADLCTPEFRRSVQFHRLEGHDWFLRNNLQHFHMLHNLKTHCPHDVPVVTAPQAYRPSAPNVPVQSDY